MMRSQQPTRILFTALLVIVVIFLYAPLFHPIFVAATETAPGDGDLQLTFERFATMFDNRMVLPSLRNSAIAAVSTAIVTTVLALLAALAVRHFTFKRTILLIMIVPLFIPGVTMGLASALFLKMLGVASSMATIVLVHVVWALPFAFLIILTVMADFKTVYLEAAHMSGANRWRAFVDIELPLIRPGLVGAAIFSGIISFNETIRTTMVQGANNTIQTYIWSQFQQVGLSPAMFALMASLILITMGLIVVMLLLFSRQGAPENAAAAQAN